MPHTHDYNKAINGLVDSAKEALDFSAEIGVSGDPLIRKANQVLSSDVSLTFIAMYGQEAYEKLLTELDSKVRGS